MLELGLKVIDRIIQLLKQRQIQSRNLFVDHIEPVFKSMEEVHKDYLVSTVELKKEIKGIKNLDDLNECIDSRKVLQESIRTKIHSYSKELGEIDSLPNEAKCFVSAYTEYFSWQSRTTDNEYFGMYSHMLSEILKNRKASKGISIENQLHKLVMTVDSVQYRVREKWASITKHYGKCRTALLK